MELLLKELSNYVLLFFVFSVFGWCMEVTLKYIQFHRFINRGFLIGPYCPIYGAGAAFVTLTVGAFTGARSSYGSTFLISFVVCGVLEYFVSWYLEKKFHARWWDYSQKPMNLHGRVWIGNLILFGIGGTFIVKIADPLLWRVFGTLSDRARLALALMIAVVMITDNVVSHFVMKFVKTSVENSEADDTETISREIRFLLHNKSVLHRRFAEAYPNVTYKTERIAAKMQAVKTEMERMKKEAAETVDGLKKGAAEGLGDLKQSAAESLGGLKQSAAEGLGDLKQNAVNFMTPSSVLREDIMEKQEELIRLLMQPDRDPEAVAALQESIEQKKAQLESRKILPAGSSLEKKA